MDISDDSIIGQIVAKNYATAAIFNNYQIDFYCNGNKSIKTACIEHHISLSTLIQELRTVLSVPLTENNVPDYNAWRLDMLAHYIEKKHHHYILEQAPRLHRHLNKITEIHGNKHPELMVIKRLFTLVIEELFLHMKKEEVMLFPYIRKMASAKDEGGRPPQPLFGDIGFPIEVMMAEHEQEGETFEKIASLSRHYQAPEDACNTYKLTYATLKDFEEDLHLHIHLENNILFPKALSLAERLKNNS
ncbi:iron-sulfur cluster repair di-iron protein [Olivibacter ginsenosidimutans]